MCNTREENAAEMENEEEGLKTVNITRSALIEKLIEYRSDDWDHHDTDEVLEYGRIGFIELSNEDLERIALDYMLEEDGVEVAYHIAAHIVRCVNSHDAIIQALKLARRKIELWPEGSNPEYFPEIKAIDAALAAAEAP